MCLAVCKPSGVKPNWQALENGFYNNPHGAGFAVSTGRDVSIHKGFFTFTAFREAFEPFAKSNALIHFRFATHGLRDEGNCHPFAVNEGLAMIHNGILDIDTSEDRTKSDTYHYVQSVLKPLSKGDAKFYRRPHIRFMGAAAIGSNNKFAFLGKGGDFEVWNKAQGVEDGGCWYSNTGFRPKSFSIPKKWYQEEPKKKEWTSMEATLSLTDSEWGLDDSVSLDSGVVDSLSDADRGHWNDLIEQYGYTELELELAIESEGTKILEEFNKCYTESLMLKEVGDARKLRLR